MQKIILSNFLLWVDQTTYLMDGERYLISDNSQVLYLQLSEMYLNLITKK
jgi:hypothetical protein